MGQVQSTLPELHQTRTGYSVVTVSIPGLYHNHNSHMCKPKVRKKRKQLSKCRKPESGARPSKDWLCEQLSARDDYDQDTRSNMAVETGGNIVLNGHTGLDMNTMKWNAWGGGSTCSVQDYPPGNDDQGAYFQPEYETITGNKIKMYPSLYKLTQNEFRRLTEQVRELPPSGKFRGSGFKKYYTGETGENVPVVYKSQLAASKKAFTDKGWAPYHNKYGNELPTRCKPIGVQDRVPSRSNTPQPPIQPRPKSVPARQRYSRSPSPTPKCTIADKAANSNKVLAPGNNADIHRVMSPMERARHAFNTTLERPRQSNMLQSNQTYVMTGKSTTSTTQQQPSSPSFRGASVPIHSYDRITPEVAYTLSNGAQPESFFCERAGYIEDDKDGLWGATNGSTTSSCEAINVVGGVEFGENKMEDKSGSDSSKDDMDAVSSTSGVVSDRDSDDDSGEDPDEPNLDSIDVNHLPDLQLRPEQLDHIYVPEYSKGDRRKYDFDINNVTIPEYEFAAPLSKEIQTLDITALSCKEHNWRHYTEKKPEDEIESNIIDRLIDLERLQKKTKDWEVTRKEKIMRLARLREAKSKIGSTMRHQSAKLRERKCCSDCTQIYCIGNCNVPAPKDNVCKLCDEYHPPGSCSQNVYTNRSRSERVSLDDEPPKPPPNQRPKSCHSCSRITSAKLINANNVVLGRPKSGHHTFSRAQNNYKPPPSRSASLSQITPEIEKELMKLGINPQSVIKQDPRPTTPQPERPSTACATETRGRAAISPGKSYFSQRRTSLTDIAKSTRRVKSAIGGRNKSRNKRPKTAS